MKKKLWGFGMVLCLMLALLGCGKSGGTEDKTKTAEHLFTTIFSTDEAMVDSFRQISGQEDLDVWAQKYFGDDMTEDGLQAAMQGRTLSQGIALQDRDRET